MVGEVLSAPGQEVKPLDRGGRPALNRHAHAWRVGHGTRCHESRIVLIAEVGPGRLNEAAEDEPIDPRQTFGQLRKGVGGIGRYGGFGGIKDHWQSIPEG